VDHIRVVIANLTTLTEDIRPQFISLKSIRTAMSAGYKARTFHSTPIEVRKVLPYFSYRHQFSWLISINLNAGTPLS
jgi:hypothetical protein